MKKSLFVFLLLVLVASFSVDSTEIDFSISPKENVKLNFKKTDSQFVTIPTNPNVYETIDTFLDKELTVKKGTISPNDVITIVSTDVNANYQTIFQLNTDEYILADPSILYSDVLISQAEVDQTFWLKKGFQFYSSPIGSLQKEIKTSFLPYQSVRVTELVQTQTDTYAHIDGKGWVSTQFLSEEDNRIEAVQALLEKKYSSKKYGIYVKQLSTNQVAGIHQENKMYAASISKLPVLYYTQEQIDIENIKLTDTLQYIDKVTTFKGSYNPEGSGSLSKSADKRKYKIEDLINRIAKESDNAATNLLAYYATNQYDGSYYQSITDIVGQKWDMSTRMASPKMAGLIMEKLYYQSGFVIESLQSTHFDQERIAKDIPVPVAHKIGDAYDFRHDVAIVYAEEPFVLSIFTEQSNYEMISQIANDIYGILK